MHLPTSSMVITAIGQLRRRRGFETGADIAASGADPNFADHVKQTACDGRTATPRWCVGL
jgi:hypothetical protein